MICPCCERDISVCNGFHRNIALDDLREAISREVFAGIIDPQTTDTAVQSVQIADAILDIPAIRAAIEAGQAA
jgi:hypothetical protein